MNVIEEVKSLEEEMIRWRRDLHQIPEIGLELPKTAAYVKKVLEEIGIPYEDHYLDGSGIVGIIEGERLPKSRKVLALRADMDGLPIQEETGLHYASLENMHACGHDSHMAMLLAAAKILYARRHEFNAKIKLIFQPGEEYPGGAEPMIEQGAFLEPKVNHVIGIHAGMLSEELPLGSIATRSGAMMASMDRFKITIEGKGVHGGYPERAQDPIVAAGQLITAIQTIKSRNISATDPAVISITRVQGGVNQNIIPDSVELEGTVRTFDNEIRYLIHDRLDQVAQGIGAALNVECTVEYNYKYPPVLNTKSFTQGLVMALSEIFSVEEIYLMEDPVMGSEDFSFYQQEAKGTFFFLCNPGEIDGKFHGHHTSKFDIDESLMYKGVATFVHLAALYCTTI